MTIDESNISDLILWADICPCYGKKSQVNAFRLKIIKLKVAIKIPTFAILVDTITLCVTSRR